MAILAAFGVGVPVFFYRMIVHEYVSLTTQIAPTVR